MLSFLLPLGAYLLGSISSAIVVSRIMDLPDPREVGSGNPGATNVLRHGGKAAATLTLVGDILKGCVPIVVAQLLTDRPAVIAAAGLATFLGHLFPVFFRFQGGKGVATGLGVYLGLSPVLGLGLVLTWLAVAALSRYSSLAALVSAALSPVYVWYLLREPAYLWCAVVITVILFWRHRTNVVRLLSGSESKISFSVNKG
ncbi:MAG: glycerol-3-phosphate 1-O-acyltransferase PlsY [Gammaproteobacteria bacterium]|nr:glycerol-3-phosphate 1-O-acyltransferase PlsY [Gammaproteobacteria bacterium]